MKAIFFFLFSIIGLTLVFNHLSGFFAIPEYAYYFMLGFWTIMMFYDIGNTTRHKQLLKFEQSFIFGFFLKKTKTKYAVVFTVLTETVLIMSSSLILFHRFEIEIISIFALVTGLIHVTGITETNKFVKKQLC